MMSSLKVVAPVVKSMYDRQKFLIINVVVPLSGGEGLREVGTGVKVTIIIFLNKYSPTGKERSIHHDDKQSMDIREV